MKTGFVALLGLPNAGKSTLMNAVIGEKVSIVSNKPQTTRQRVMGIWNEPGVQAVFVDAPGILHSASSELNKFLIEEYQDVLSGSDLAVLVLSPEPKFMKPQERVLTLVIESKKPAAAIITKGDLASHEEMGILIKQLEEAKIEYIIVSALKDKKETRENVLKLIGPKLPESDKAMYDEDMYTTQTIRNMTAEIIREKCFENLSQELPYGLAIKVVEFKELEDITRVNAEILVVRESHKGIVIGKGGALLKKIGSDSRKDLEKLIGGKVYMEIFAKAKPDWMKNRGIMKELGYVIQN